MRKFAFKSIVACMAGFFVTQVFAQPRDLFAEFEEEAAAAEAQSSSSVVESSSSVAVSSSATVPSSSAVASSSSEAVSSSSVSSSSEASSSSVAESSSSLTPEEEYARAMAKMNAERQEAIRQATEQARIADSIRQAELPQDSAMRAQDSLMDIQDQLLDAQDAAMPIYVSSSSEVAAVESSSSSEASAVPSSSSMSRRDLLGPVKVSKVHGMDEIKGKYKDPRKALFMSLVIPGAGQLYTGGSTFTTVRGAVYLALEAGLWSGWYYYSVYKYGKQVTKYKDYAKEHYSIGRYERAMRDLYDADGVNYSEVFRSRYLGSRESFCEAIYGDAKARGCYNRDNLYTNDAGYMSDFVNKPVALENEMKGVKFDNPNEVYSLIAGDAYVLGWDVVTNTKTATDLDLEDPNASTVRLGLSKRQDEYRELRKKATDYADMQAWFFGGLILNHVISAVDAALTANSYNKTLYQEDLSWYDHIHLDGGVSWFDGLGVTVQASWGF